MTTPTPTELQNWKRDLPIVRGLASPPTAADLDTTPDAQNENPFSDTPERPRERRKRKKTRDSAGKQAMNGLSGVEGAVGITEGQGETREVDAAGGNIVGASESPRNRRSRSRRKSGQAGNVAGNAPNHEDSLPVSVDPFADTVETAAPTREGRHRRHRKNTEEVRGQVREVFGDGENGCESPRGRRKTKRGKEHPTKEGEGNDPHADSFAMIEMKEATGTRMTSASSAVDQLVPRPPVEGTPSDTPRRQRKHKHRTPSEKQDSAGTGTDKVEIELQTVEEPSNPSARQGRSSSRKRKSTEPPPPPLPAPPAIATETSSSTPIPGAFAPHAVPTPSPASAPPVTFSASPQTQPPTHPPHLFSHLHPPTTPSDFADHCVSVTVHRTDQLSLVPDIRVRTPVVRVSFIDLETGEYLRKSDPARPVSAPREGAIDYILPIVTKPFDLPSHATITPQWSEELIFNEDYLHILAHPSAAAVFEILDWDDHTPLPPGYTSPSTSSRPAEQRVKQKHEWTPLRSFPKAQARDPDVELSGWRRVAFAFLKLVGRTGPGAHGYPRANTESTVRLQLYHYRKHSAVLGDRDRICPVYPSLRPQPLLSFFPRPGRIKYPGSLFVTIKAHVAIGARRVGGRPVFATDVEVGKVGYDDMVEEWKRRVEGGGGVWRSLVGMVEKPNWRRSRGQQCKIPNRLQCTIDAGPKGCSTLAFSHQGLYLSFAALSPPSNSPIASSHPIKLYHLPSYTRVASLPGHHGPVYQLAWSHDDSLLASASADSTARVWTISESGVRQTHSFRHPGYVYTCAWHPMADWPRILFTGGWDSRVRAWRCEGADAGEVDNGSARPVGIFSGHETYVNCIAFTGDGTKMFSGDGGGMVRVWSCTVGQSAEGRREEDTPMKEPDWMAFECIKIITVARAPIRSLRMHPTNRKLLFLSASTPSEGSVLRTVDVRVHRTLTTLAGEGASHTHRDGTRLAGSAAVSVHSRSASPTLLRSRSPTATSVTTLVGGRETFADVNPTHLALVSAEFTPCGTYVVAGSTDGRVYMFNAETGYIAATYADEPQDETLEDEPVTSMRTVDDFRPPFPFFSARTSRSGKPTPVLTLSFHPLDHFLAIGGFGERQPLVVYKYEKPEGAQSREHASANAPLHSRRLSFRGLSDSDEKLQSNMTVGSCLHDTFRTHESPEESYTAMVSQTNVTSQIGRQESSQTVAHSLASTDVQAIPVEPSITSSQQKIASTKKVKRKKQSSSRDILSSQATIPEDEGSLVLADTLKQLPIPETNVTGRASDVDKRRLSLFEGKTKERIGSIDVGRP
ncbi:WD40 repeat-like protein [Gonapodya prolifera JEL478]|uniref:WD40 repeat-like protein n=1 Tax=Gonapodya prolifera (strain JEL478) TaxID=1344416 RepID=A0A139A783_GONPJ|nr:WD40 repeat-like protein [Gonapodya prolifera JEL478]|eukprot:KXS12203.1 WD40 repeat-like protein [Gonapodya prolifera JEL478]